MHAWGLVKTMALGDVKRKVAFSHYVKTLRKVLVGRFDSRFEYEWSRKIQYELPSVFPRPRNAIESLAQTYGDMNEHAMTLYMLTVELGLKNILELGTRKGDSTMALLEAAKAIGGKVTSVDIAPCESAKKRVRAAGLEAYWELVMGDDLSVPWSRPIDHLFIDTAHEYEHTLKELRRFEPFVMPGGVMTFHDVVSAPEVARAVDEYVRARRDLRCYRFFHNNGLDIVRKGR